MTHFLRLLSEDNKVQALVETCSLIRSGARDSRLTELAPSAFNAIPGKPFAYWISDAVRATFRALQPFEGDGRTVRVGLQTSYDFRFVRIWWEPIAAKERLKWVTFAKGGKLSPYYYDQPLVIKWFDDGKELMAFPPSVVSKPRVLFPCRHHLATASPTVFPAATSVWVSILSSRVFSISGFRA